MAHDVSRELRGHHGEWTKGEAALHRMAGEATKAAEGKHKAGDKVTYKTGAKGTVHHIDDKGRVHVVWDRGRGKPVATPAHHLTSATDKKPAEKAAREVTGAKEQTAKDLPKPSESLRTITARDLKPGMVVSSGHWQAPKGPHEIAKLERSGAGSRSGGVRSSHGIYNTASTHVTSAEGRKYEVSNNTKFKVHKEAPKPDLGYQNQRAGQAEALRRIQAKPEPYKPPRQAGSRGGVPAPTTGPSLKEKRAAQAAEQKRLADIQAMYEFARTKSMSPGGPAAQEFQARIRNAAGMTPELQAQLREIQAAEKARVEAENKARHPGGSVTEYNDMLNKPNLAGGATPPKTSVPTTHYNGQRITAMSDRQLQIAAKKSNIPAIKDEIQRRGGVLPGGGVQATAPSKTKTEELYAAAMAAPAGSDERKRLLNSWRVSRQSKGRL